MISKETALKMFSDYNEEYTARLIDGRTLKIRKDDYEYLFTADEVNYVGDGSNFLVAQLNDDGWASHGNPTFSESILTLDGSSWLSRSNISLGGSDFQISGKVYESATDMIARRKIFELYTSAELNVSLYSSGAGKNLDLLVKCGGTFDNYNEPAIIGAEYTFALKYRQSTRRMRLYVNGAEVYSFEVASFGEAKSFEQVALGAGISHENANWLGTISEFKIYSGYAEA